MITCPTCGGEYDPPALAVDLIRHTAVIGGQVFRLRPQLLELYIILMDAYPRLVTFEHMAARLWGGTEGPADEYGVIKVQICNLRSAIKGSGWQVKNSYGAGYRLVEA